MARVNVRNRPNKDGKDNWEYSFELDRIDGQRKRRTKGGFKTKKEALKAGTDELSAYNKTGQIPFDVKTSIKQFAEQEYFPHVKARFPYRTADIKIRSLDLFLNWYGNCNISKFNYKLAEEYVTKLIERNLAKNTIVTYKTSARNLFEFALMENEITRVIQNPFAHVRVPEVVENTGNPHELYDAETLKKHLAAYKGDVLETVLMLGIHAGLRKSEMCALTWNDIDFDKRTISVNKQLYKPKGENHRFKSPKYNSVRDVHIVPELLTYLRKLKAEQESVPYRYTYKELPDRSIIPGNDFSFVVCGKNGKIQSSESITGRLNRNKIDINPLKSHSLRHTYCSNCIERGIDPQYVQRQLGHKSIMTTYDVYSHLSPEQEKEQAAKLDKIDL